MNDGHQEVEADRLMAEKTNSAILPRGGTAFTFPDENLNKSVKTESVKNFELCRLDRIWHYDTILSF